MKKRNLCLLASLMIITIKTASFAQMPAIPPFLLPPLSPAVVADPLSLSINPAGLAFTDPALLFLHANSDSTFKGDNAFFLATHQVGFGIEWLGRNFPADGKRYHLGFGGKLGRGVSFGTTYSWIDADRTAYDKFFTWNFGLTYRQSRYVALALVAQNWNQHQLFNQKIPRQYTASVAVRPIGERLTIALDGFLKQRQTLDDLTYRVFAAFEPLPGLVLQGSVAKGGDFGLGMRFNLAHLFYGSFQNFADKGGYQSGTNYVGLSAVRFPSFLEPKNNLLIEPLSGDLPEERSKPFLFGPFGENFYDKIERIQKAKTDPTVKALLLRIGGLNAGFGKLQELRQAIFDFKSSGKPVAAYLDQPDNRTYYLATAADLIVIPPVSELELIGLKAEVTFVKHTLAKLGIVAEMEHIGEYKNASDLLTRTSMSEAHREVVNAMLDDYYAQFTEAIAKGRGKSQSEVAALIDRGPFISIEAQKAGLVDTFLYWDQVEKYLQARWQKSLRKLDAAVYAECLTYEPSWETPPKIAVVVAAGDIVDGKSGNDFLFGKTLGDLSMVAAIDRAKNDPQVKAVVLRIDSPGGSGTASDVIWRELQLVKEKKPLIVSMSDVAASGGYYIAAPGEKIFASPGTVTGSIGVISGKLNQLGLYEKIGFDKEVVTRGKRADIWGTTRGFNEEERQIVRHQIDEFYKNFIHLVGEGRRVSDAYVDSVGRGRVWSGHQAKERKLIDEYGGLWEAIAEAKKRAGLAVDRKVKVLFLPQPKFAPFGSSGLLARIQSALGGEPLTLKSLFTLDNLFNGQPLYLPPYLVEIK